MMTMADVEAAACAPMGGTHVDGVHVDGLHKDGVHVDGEWVTIRRRIAGLSTQINVPTSSYRGVTLRSAAPSAGFEIALLHIDPSLDVILTACVDDTDLIATWRRYARDLGLPLLVADREGRLQPLQEAAGCACIARRSGSPLRHRRPRFLSRRQIGCPVAGAPSASLSNRV